MSKLYSTGVMCYFLYLFYSKQNRSRKGGGDPSKSRELTEVWGGAPGGGSPSRGELESIVTAKLKQ